MKIRIMYHELSDEFFQHSSACECEVVRVFISKLRIKRLMKRWKHSGGIVINAG